MNIIYIITRDVLDTGSFFHEYAAKCASVGIVVEAVAQISEANRQKQLSAEAKNLFSDVRDTEKIDKEIREHIAKIEELLKARGHTQKTEVAE